MGDNNFKRLSTVATQAVLSKVSLPVLAIVGAVFVLIILVVIAIVASDDLGGGGKIDGGNKELPEKVLMWEYDINKAVEKHDLEPEEITPVLLAILNQESGGEMINSNGDIFQSSESKCGSIGCITDPVESIDQAVVHFKNNLEKSKGNLEVAIASYNFGNGFASWTQENHDNKWSKDIAIEFSQHMMDKVSNPENYTCIREEAKEHDACYGDILYVTSITDYLPQNHEYSTNEGSKLGKGDTTFSGTLKEPLDQVIVTDNYGMRIHPIENIEKLHTGIDLGCVGGVTPIKSAGAGKVIYSDSASTYGNTIIIKHENNFYTHYAHMSSLIADVGDEVSSGDKIGVCGSTGGSTAAHLHFETKTEEWGGHINPRDYLDFPNKP